MLLIYQRYTTCLNTKFFWINNNCILSQWELLTFLSSQQQFVNNLIKKIFFSNLTRSSLFRLYLRSQLIPDRWGSCFWILDTMNIHSTILEARSISHTSPLYIRFSPISTKHSLFLLFEENNKLCHQYLRS